MKAFLFDLDGTLVDSEPMWARALRTSLDELRCRLGEHEVDELVYGRSWLDIHADLVRMFPDACSDRTGLEATIERHFNALKTDTSFTLESSVALLIQLAGDHPVAIVSGSGRKMVADWIRDLHLDPYIDFYLGCEDYPNGKPDPACYRMAADRLELPPNACLVFEDSTAGVNAAKAAGMYCVALRRDGARKQDLNAADWVVNDFAEVDTAGLGMHPPQFRSRS